MDLVADGLLVGREHFPRALGKRLFQTHHHVLHRDHGAHLEVTAQYHRVEQFGLTHLRTLGRGVDRIDFDVLAHGVPRDAVRVVDQHAARLDHRLEFLHRLLVQDDRRVEFMGDRRRNLPVGENYRHVGRAAAHLGTVGGHPRHLEILHHPRVSQNLTHREDALSSESCNYQRLFHSVTLF